MELIKGYIYGYGKFSGLPIEFRRGLQVVITKDDADTTTMIQFLIDMFVGQKDTSLRGRTYTENFYRYSPWHNQDYRGFLSLQMQDGTIFHIHRRFGPEPNLRILEGIESKEITGRFTQNQDGTDVDVPQILFHISSRVFPSWFWMSSQECIEALEKKDIQALRRRILGFLDSGNFQCTHEQMIEVFNEHLDKIGSSRSNQGFYSRLVEQVEALKTEYQNSFDIQMKIRKNCLLLQQLEQNRQQLTHEVENLRQKIYYSEMNSLWRRKNDAYALQEILNHLTAKSFAYSHLRNFPIHLKNQVLELEHNQYHLEMQRSKLQEEINAITAQINCIEEEIQRKPVITIEHIEEYQDLFEQIMHNIEQVDHVLGELIQQRQQLEQQIKEIELEIDSLPEPIRVNDKFADELEGFINLVTNSKQETEKSQLDLENLQEEYQQELNELERYVQLFQNVPNFPELAREYWKYLTMPEEEKRELQDKMTEINTKIRDILLSQPSNVFLFSFCFVVTLVLLYLFFNTNQFSSLGFSIVTILISLYFFGEFLNNKLTVSKQIKLRSMLEEEIRRLNSSEFLESHPITQLMEKAEVKHLRELEGLFEEYKIRLKRKAELEQKIHDAEELFRINQERTKQLFETLKSLFASVGLNLESEEQIPTFFDKVRLLQDKSKAYHKRLWDLKEQMFRLSENIDRKEKTKQQYESDLQTKVYEKIKDPLIQSGVISPETPITRDTFSTYYEAEARYRELRAEVTQLRTKRLQLNAQLQRIESELQEIEQEIQEILKETNTDSIQTWKKLCTEAEEGIKLFDKIEKTSAQLQNTLGDYTFQELEEKVKDFVPMGDIELEDNLNYELNKKMASLIKLHQEIESLQKENSQLSKKVQPLHQLLEKIHWCEHQINKLKQEQEATISVIATLQEVKQKHYAKYLPKLKEEANSLLKLLTQNRYELTDINEQVLLKIWDHQDKKVIDLEEMKKLQNTKMVFYVYLALRLALRSILAPQKENLPILLELPTSTEQNSTDSDLLIALKRIQEKIPQIFLFVNHLSVSELAHQLNIPVHSIV